MGKPQWIGGSKDKGETPRIHKEIETIINNLQERLNSHDNRLTGNGVKMGIFAYASLGNLKDDVLKEMPRGSFGLFVNACSLCTFCNKDYTSESSLL